jgi:hypothetical protein
MGFTSFRDFQDLFNRGYVPKRIGFPKNVGAGDINRLNTRLRVARDFESISIRGLGAESTLGYEAFFRVFLAHSALERFLRVVGYNVHEIEDKLSPHDCDKVFATISKCDAQRKLHDFLVPRLEDKPAKRLTACYDGDCRNTTYVSAAIRHIFAHGHLSPQANGIRPKSVHNICSALSQHLIAFMDFEFTMRIEAGKAKALRDARL